MVRPDVDVRTYKFADKVREECVDRCAELGICPWTEHPEEKAKIRSILVEVGGGRRQDDPRYWITRLEETLDADKEPGIRLVTDVRYTNEAEFLLRRKAIIVLMRRPGFGPLNEEEAEHTSKLYSPTSPLAYQQAFRDFWWTHELCTPGKIKASVMREQECAKVRETLPELRPFLFPNKATVVDRDYQQYLEKRGLRVPKSLQIV
jgi:hypothetical protein